MTPLFLRFNTSEVTLSGFTGGEYLPLPASKGPAFPFLLTLDGYPTSPADYAQKQRSPLKNSGNSNKELIADCVKGTPPKAILIEGCSPDKGEITRKLKKYFL